MYLEVISKELIGAIHMGVESNLTCSTQTFLKPMDYRSFFVSLDIPINSTCSAKLNWESIYFDSS